MEECIASLGKAAVSSSLNAVNVYSQVEIRNDDREKITISSNRKLYHFERMSFEPRNSPSKFQ